MEGENTLFAMFSLSEPYRSLKNRVEKFAQSYDESLDETPPLHDRLNDFADEGLYNWLFPPEYGGSLEVEYDVLALSIIREVLSYYGTNLDNAFISQALGGYPIYQFGNDDQKQQYLPLIASGELLPAFAITEPEAGSDVASIKSRAIKKDDRYILNGEKKFISYALKADLFIVFAKTQPDEGSKGISAFVVPAHKEGIEREGHDVITEHEMANLTFKDVEVPMENRIGEEGDGMSIALRNLEIFRTTVGAAAVGMAQAALDVSVNRVKQRSQFGKTLSKFQGIQFKIADMATKVRSSRLMVYSAAAAKNNQTEARTETSMAKLHATERASEVIDEAVQIFGGDGVSKGFRVEELYREIRPLLIYEGTSEIQKLIISREFLRS